MFLGFGLCFNVLLFAYIFYFLFLGVWLLLNYLLFFRLLWKRLLLSDIKFFYLPLFKVFTYSNENLQVFNRLFCDSWMFT
jgi:hypothetical protein